MPNSRANVSEWPLALRWPSAVTLVTVLVAAVGACGKSKPPGEGMPGTGGAGGSAGRTSQKLVILHTNDLHSHLMGQPPEADYTPATTNDDATRGGFARLASAVTAARTQAMATSTPVLLLDAGDFMMGTLFQLLGTSKAPELKLMQAMGYDATTVGNHELDWTPAGLAGILNAALSEGISLPILSSNMVFSGTNAGDDQLKALADAGAIRPKLIKTVGGLKVGFFGLLGADAAQVTPQAAPLTFEPIAVAAARMVRELRENDKVDLVIALSHSGINSGAVGEDEKLARAVAGIDVIISGHSHATLTTPAKIGQTVIVTAGAYGRNLGQLSLTVTPNATAGGAATVAIDDYQLLNIDDTVMGDVTTQAAIEGYITDLNTTLMPSGLGYRLPVAETPADLTLPSYAEGPIGNLVTDAYLRLVSALQPTDPPVVAVEGNGQLRSSLVRGQTGLIWFADLFRVLPLGIGADGQPGFALVTYYLNATDIRAGFELGGASEAVDDQYFLQVSGLKVEYDMSRPVFGRVSSLRLVGANGVEQALDLTDTTRCFKVVSTNYVAGLLGVVRSFTGGLLAVDAKAADCTTLVDPTTRLVDADPAAAGVQELKHWQALLKYVSMFPDSDADTIPNIPAAYTAPQGRITKN